MKRKNKVQSKVKKEVKGEALTNRKVNTKKT